ncbi:hypothetical protein STEG23_022833, partial [Scotinomys teguina]
MLMLNWDALGNSSVLHSPAPSCHRTSSSYRIASQIIERGLESVSASSSFIHFLTSPSLNSWDRIEEVEKKIESFTKVIQGPKETFIDFLERLTSAINRMVPNSKARQTIIESLAFENANSQCKKPCNEAALLLTSYTSGNREPVRANSSLATPTGLCGRMLANHRGRFSEHIFYKQYSTRDHENFQ